MSRRETRLAAERARKIEAADDATRPLLPAERDSRLSTQEQLREAYDAMLQRDGEPIAPHAGEDEMTRPLDVQAPQKPKKRKKKHRWMWWVFPLLAILIAVGVFAFMLFTQAMTVKDDLTSMKNELQTVVDQVKAGDTAGVEVTAEKIKTLSAKANETVDSPLWDVAAQIPFVGANIEAVAETTKATDIIVAEALPSVLQLLATFDPSSLKVEGGGFNLQPFRDAVPLLPALSGTFAKAQTHLDKIDRDAILPFVEENIGQVVDMVGQATPPIKMGEK